MTGGPKALAEANGETPRYGGIFLSVANETIDQFDPHQTSLGGIYASTSLAYSGLLGTSPYDPQGVEVIPDLARSWELEDGGKTVIFHLAENVKWHDGTPFSSADVEFSINRIMNPPEGVISPRQGIVRSLVESVEATDPNTIVLNGLGASGLLVPLWSNGWNAMVPKHILEADPVDGIKSIMVGTGAFILKENTTTFFRFERNPDYFQKDLPYLDEIHINVITDPQTVANQVLAERIFWTGPYRHPNLGPDLGQATAAREPQLEYSFGGNVVASLHLQTNNPPFDDLRVRQAINEAIDREAIIELGTETGAVGTGTLPTGPWATPVERRETFTGFGPDMEVRRAHARELLSSYESEKGEIDWGSMPLNCISNILFSCGHAQIVQQMLKQIGVEIELNPLLLTPYRDLEVSGDYLWGLSGAAYDFDDPIDVFGQSYITNGGRWYHRQSVPEIDRLYEEQKFEPDLEKRKELVWQMDEIAMNQSGWIMLQWWDFHHLRWPYVKGWTPSPIARSTNSRMIYTWLDFPELPTSRP
jgi:peptide/nickel transport system substrate-binding protein